MGEPWLVFETSGRGGRVGLAAGGAVVDAVALDPVRRHNRDLAPAVDGLLRAAGLTPRQVYGVAVSVGPGSYTGLRVGVMSAKVLAYAADCRLVAVPTFDAVAEQTPEAADAVEVIADGLQGLVYAQPFRRADGGGWGPSGDLRIGPAAEWAGRLRPGAWVSGPGVGAFDGLIPGGVHRVPHADRSPGLTALFRVALRLPPLTAADVRGLEPLYLRPSSAEEKAASGAGR